MEIYMSSFLSSKLSDKNYNLLIDTMWDVIGGFLYAVAVYGFAKSASFAPGGVSGVALILNHLTNLPIGVMTLVLNIPLIFISYKVIGKDFLIKSLRSMIVCSFFVDMVFPHLPLYSGDSLLAAIYYGIFMGAGLSLIYMRGSSTGGTDFLILSVKTKVPHLSIGLVSAVIDCTVILLGWPVYGNIDAVLYGLISTFTASIILDKFMYGVNARKLLLIITTKGEEIAELINDSTGRGSTYIKAMGTYSKEDKDIIMCACSKSQVYIVTNKIHQADHDAFIMITETSEVFGEGFIERKTK